MHRLLKLSVLMLSLLCLSSVAQSLKVCVDVTTKRPGIKYQLAGFVSDKLKSISPALQMVEKTDDADVVVALISDSPSSNPGIIAVSYSVSVRPPAACKLVCGGGNHTMMEGKQFTILLSQGIIISAVDRIADMQKIATEAFATIKTFLSLK